MKYPVITIDGPASSGKGTVARKLAHKLGMHYLDSGAIYRAVAFLAARAKLIHDNALDEGQLLQLIKNTVITCLDDMLMLDNENIMQQVRDEKIGMLASTLGQNAKIREVLLKIQRDYAIAPGLVTDGRDMGSVVFKNADLKIFLTANSEVRARRRYEQLQQSGKSATMAAVLRDILVRDGQDSSRRIAPLSHDASFIVVDNSSMTIDDTVDLLLHYWGVTTQQLLPAYADDN